MKKQLVVTLLVLFGVIAAQCGGPAATQAPAPAPTQASTPTQAVEQAPTPTQAAPEQPPAALDGKALLQEHCTVCHDLTRVESKNKSEADWKATVERMVSKGAKLNPAEQEAVIKYLALTYPK